MDGALGAAVTRSADELTPRLQQRAKDLGWRKEIAESLTISVDPETQKLIPQWPDEANDHVLDYEGGSQDREAMPALYKFFDSAEGDREVRGTVRKNLVDDLAAELISRMFP